MIILTIVDFSPSLIQLSKLYELTLIYLINSNPSSSYLVQNIIKAEKFEIILHKEDAVKLRLQAQGLKIQDININLKQVKNDLDDGLQVNFSINLYVKEYQDQQFMIQLQFEEISNSQQRENYDNRDYSHIRAKLRNSTQKRQKSLSQSKIPSINNSLINSQKISQANFNINKSENLSPQSYQQNIKTYEVLNQKLEQDLLSIKQKISLIPSLLLNQNIIIPPSADFETQHGFKANHYIEKFVSQIKNKIDIIEKFQDKEIKKQNSARRFQAHQEDQEIFKQSQRIMQGSPMNKNIKQFQDDEYFRVFNKANRQNKY